MSRDFDCNYKNKNEPFRVGVKAIVFNSDGKFLLLQRSNMSGKGGFWSLPGGALEYGEDVYQAVRREIEEETLLNVNNIETFSVVTHSDPKSPLLIIGFTCTYVSGDVDLNWEHDDHKWVSKEESQGYKLTPDANELINKVLTDEGFKTVDFPRSN